MPPWFLSRYAIEITRGGGGGRYSDIPLSLEIKHFTDPLIPCILRRILKSWTKKKERKEWIKADHTKWGNIGTGIRVNSVPC